MTRHVQKTRRGSEDPRRAVPVWVVDPHEALAGQVGLDLWTVQPGDKLGAAGIAAVARTVHRKGPTAVAAKLPDVARA